MQIFESMALLEKTNVNHVWRVGAGSTLVEHSDEAITVSCMAGRSSCVRERQGPPSSWCCTRSSLGSSPSLPFPHCFNLVAKKRFSKQWKWVCKNPFSEILELKKIKVFVMEHVGVFGFNLFSVSFTDLLLYRAFMI